MAVMKHRVGGFSLLKDYLVLLKIENRLAGADLGEKRLCVELVFSRIDWFVHWNFLVARPADPADRFERGGRFRD
jgi:hypothetical protein